MPVCNTSKAVGIHDLRKLYVGGSSKIQTLCHMTQILLKLRFTAMERHSQVIKVGFLHQQMCRYITTSVYITQQTHLNWHVII